MIRMILVFFLVIVLLDTAMAKSFLPPAFSGNFVQKKKSISGSRTITSNLVVKYQYPSNFYLKDMSNDGTIYVCNRSKVWVYTPPFIPGEQGELAVGSSGRHCYSRIFDSLRSGLKNNKAYSVKKVDDKNFKLTFKGAARSRLDVSYINLRFKSKKYNFSNINQLQIKYIRDNNTLTLTPSTFRTLKKFPAGTFNFDKKIPKNTKKVRI